MTERLVVLQTPHPRGLLRELRTNPEQLARQRNTPAAFNKKAPIGVHRRRPRRLGDGPRRARALRGGVRRSDFEAMLNYYKANYPREPYADVPLLNVQAPVLIIHGEDDPFLLTAGHNGTYDWVDAPVTLVTVPGVSHFIQQDASSFVSRTIHLWLHQLRRR